jgi:hypothetical protein
MARTKQTCKKTTGGSAKRGVLPKFKKLTGHGGIQVLKTVQSKGALPSGEKAVLKPLYHNIVSLQTSVLLLVCSSQNWISSAFFAGMGALCMNAPYAHA